MGSFAFWYWLIAGCICVGPLLSKGNVKTKDKWWAFLGGFMLLPMMLGIFWDDMWTKYGDKDKEE